MIPTSTLLDAIVTRIAADAGTLAHATDGVNLHLAKNSFTPSPDIALVDLDEADFDGYAIVEAGPGAQQWFVDPTTGQRVVQILEPAGGWHFETTGITGLPMTIYGAYLTNNANTVLYGTMRFADPIVLGGNNEAVDVGNVRLTITNEAIY